MNHLMIDLETLDVSRDTVILSAGVVIFNKTSDLVGLRLFMKIKEQIEAGRTIGADTVKWWILTDVNKFCEHLSVGAYDLNYLKESILRLYENYEIERVWSRGSFDLEILKTIMDVPWEYWQERDVRTLDELAPAVKSPKKHDALEDCLAQVKHVRKVLWKE